MKQHSKKRPWSLGRVIEVFFLVFGALTVAVPMTIAMGARETEAFSQGQIQGFLLAGFGLMEAGKDISFNIGACIALLAVGILQLVL